MVNEIRKPTTRCLSTQKDAEAASKLTRLYCRKPLSVNKIVLRNSRNYDQRLLSDVIKVGKHGFEQIETVGFVSIRGINPRKEGDGEGGFVNVIDLFVNTFAIQPGYSEEIAVGWVDYLLNEIFKHNQDLPPEDRYAYVKNFIWDVDELNRPLIDELVKWKYTVADYSAATEIITFAK